MAGYHFHKCSNGHEFGHEQTVFEKTEEEYNAAHDCPQCGENVRDVSGFPDAQAEKEFLAIHAEQFLRFLLGK